MAGSVLGEKVLRKEDPKFLTTGGVYIDDFTDPRLDGAVHVVFARSHVAHGTINSIDTSEAEGMPGVVAVHTAASLGLQPQPSNFNPGVARTLLASEKVRWVGEPIAAIIAETYEQATDAAQSVIADIDPLPALIDVEEALASDTHIYEAAGGNAVFDSVYMAGDAVTATDVTFSGECTGALVDVDKVVVQVLDEGFSGVVDGDHLAAHPRDTLGLDYFAEP